MNTPCLTIFDHPFTPPVDATADTCAYWYEADKPAGDGEPAACSTHICGQERFHHKYEYGSCRMCSSTLKLRKIRSGWLREERRSRGVSLRDAAKALKMSAAYLSDIELGRRDPSEDKKEAICAYYDSLTMRGPEEEKS